jgi:hypothetical protein
MIEEKSLAELMVLADQEYLILERLIECNEISSMLQT